MKEKRNVQINLRVTQQEKETLQELAEKENKSISDFIRDKSLSVVDKEQYTKDIQMYLQKIDKKEEENQYLLKQQTNFLEILAKDKDEISSKNQEILELKEKLLLIENRSFSQKLKALFSK